jgi:L-lactate dehydrogenase complex protein LldG
VSGREQFLARVARAQPASVELPDVPLFPAPAGDLVERFREALLLMGGKAQPVQDLRDAQAAVRAVYGDDAKLLSALPEWPGDMPFDVDAPPASFAGTDVAIVRARFGVAETGSVFISDLEYRVNAIGYLAQHLVVLLSRRAIVAGLQDAYRRDDLRSTRYAALVTGPSATADIEGVLIRGAQGVRSLTVLLEP